MSLLKFQTNANIVRQWFTTQRGCVNEQQDTAEMIYSLFWFTMNDSPTCGSLLDDQILPRSPDKSFHQSQYVSQIGRGGYCCASLHLEDVSVFVTMESLFLWSFFVLLE